MKKGQMKLSFGMLFSIILIIAFIAFAIYGIIFILDLQKTGKVGTFYDSFQSDVDSLWRGTFGEQPVSYELPGEIEKVCLKQTQYDEEKNLYLLPRDHGIKIEDITIEHLDIAKTLEGRENDDPDNAICFGKINGKIQMILKKDYGENLVTVLKS